MLQSVKVKRETEQKEEKIVDVVEKSIQDPADNEETEMLKENVPGIPDKLQEDVKKIVVSPKSLTLEDAVIEAGKIKSLMEMMDSYYYDYLSPDAAKRCSRSTACLIF